MGELNELLNGADMAPIGSAVQWGELPLIPHIHLVHKTQELLISTGYLTRPLQSDSPFLAVADAVQLEA